MKRILRSTVFFMSLAAAAVLSSQSAARDAVQLELGKPIQKEMRPDEIHKYRIDLVSGRFLYGYVAQQGIDIMVRIIDPEGKQIDEIDSPTGETGLEDMLLVTEKDGDYIIEIHPFDPLADSGHYTIKIERVENAAKTSAGKVDQLFVPWNKIDSPGAAIAVVWNGKVVYKKGYGAANLEYEIPNTPSTIFHMASVSKQFTAFSAACLAQRGKLSLDDDIRKYIPEVPDFGKTITVRHLIHHTSGLRDQWNLLGLAGYRLDDVITKEHVLKLVSHQKELNFNSGDEYLYCNTGYTLLAEIVARVTGKTFSEWTRENIFEPLGMTNTLFYDDHEKIVPNRAYSYRTADSQGFKKSVLSYANVGATSLFTSAEDLARWAINFDDPVVGNKELIKQMEEQGVLNSGVPIGYAFGQGIGRYKGLRTISHSGGDAGYRTHLVRFPEQKFSVMVLSNLASMNPGGMALKIADIYLADLLEEEKPEEKPEKIQAQMEVDSAVLEAYTGEYMVEPGVRGSIIRRGSRLYGQMPGQQLFQLIPISETRFKAEERNLEWSFDRDSSGKVFQAVINEGGKDTAVPKVEPFTLDSGQLAGLTGEFYSDELGTAYTFVMKENQLVARHRRHDDIALTPTDTDKFSANRWFLRDIQFVRDEQGRITGCRVSSGRVRNLLFEKVD